MADGPSSPGLDYRSAGVDIDVADDLLAGVRRAIERTHGPRVLGGLGHFGGFYRIGPAGAEATLVASIDSVGTKLRVAILANWHEGIGADIVHHCVNDILACGARPLFFLDYFATGKLDPQVAATVIEGIAAACQEFGIALLGGETAEMPGIYHGEDYDLAGTIVGLVEAGRIIDGASIRAGDIVVGLPSDGFHTNGYSLIRAALKLNGDEDSARERLRQVGGFGGGGSLAEALLTPHRCYLKDVAPLLETGLVTGMAHITGGGIPGNLSRIVPPGQVAEIDAASWSVPPLMTYVAEQGRLSLDECYRVFNMGVGFIVVCRPDVSGQVLDSVPGSTIIGKIAPTQGDQRVVLSNLGLS